MCGTKTVVDGRTSWRMDFVRAEEDQSSAGAGVAEVVYSELTTLHSEVGDCFGTGDYSGMVTETLVVVIGGRRCSSSYGLHSHWHMQVLLMVIWAQEILDCRRICYEEPEFGLDLAGTTLEHSSRWHACRSGRRDHSAVVEAAMGLEYWGRCCLACTFSSEAYEALLH